MGSMRCDEFGADVFLRGRATLPFAHSFPGRHPQGRRLLQSPGQELLGGGGLPSEKPSAGDPWEGSAAVMSTQELHDMVPGEGHTSCVSFCGYRPETLHVSRASWCRSSSDRIHSGQRGMSDAERKDPGNCPCHPKPVPLSEAAGGLHPDTVQGGSLVHVSCHGQPECEEPSTLLTEECRGQHGKSERTLAGRRQGQEGETGIEGSERPNSGSTRRGGHREGQVHPDRTYEQYHGDLGEPQCDRNQGTA